MRQSSRPRTGYRKSISKKYGSVSCSGRYPETEERVLIVQALGLLLAATHGETIGLMDSAETSSIRILSALSVRCVTALGT